MFEQRVLKCRSAAADTKCFSHAFGRQARGFNPVETNQHLSPALAQEYILETENKCQQDVNVDKKSSQETALF
ncbi:hypothetical protein [uncultured Algoriphagus sp.]|uniref:hypothetical protein n=1 Tax=uncultured Algoriphagus sp. TaxID=417365 RepID=UPI002583516A|nr:hypothetical protein [uncultured Algoriphagus sp.]